MRASAGRLLLGLVLLTSACAGAEGDPEVASSVEGALRTAVTDGAPVRFADVVDGEWQRLVFVCPYDDEATIEERLGFEWSDFPGMDRTEGVSRFLFVRDEEVVSWTTVSRPDGDPCGTGASTALDVARDDARYTVVRTGETADGRAFHSLRRAG